MLLGQMRQGHYGCKASHQFHPTSFISNSHRRSVELNVGIMCACLPLLSPLGRKLPGTNYLKDQYNSMVSRVRGSRKDSRGLSRSRGSRSASENNILPDSKNSEYAHGDYMELQEPGGKRDREMHSTPQAMV